MEKTRTQQGKDAESLAAQWLQKEKGYSLIVQGFRWKRGEADLIMSGANGALILVEVRSASRVSPWLKQSINARKLHHLQQTLEVFLYKNPGWRGRERRIELIWCVAGVIEHWPCPL